jgi:acetylornithine deacetylase/succinyl-diaminopimelate desuccinylase-like protein
MTNPVQVNRESLLSLAKDVISYQTDRDNEGALAQYLADRLRSNGLQVHDEDVVAGRPNVIVRVPGKDSSQLPLVINAHMDGAYHLGGWSRDPLEGWVEGDKLFGAAASDMKGGLASMVSAIESAAKDKSLPRDLILHAVMHHDTVGLGAKYVLASEGPFEGFGICGEPTNMGVVYTHGGAVKFKITVTGKASHISRIEDGVDALSAAVAIYSKIPQIKLTHKNHEVLTELPRVLVGVLNGGIAAGCIAPEASMLGDVRTLPDMTRETVYDDLKKLVDEFAVDGCTYKIKLTAVQKSFVGKKESTLMTALSNSYKKVRGSEIEVITKMPTQAFVTDTADMSAIGLEALVFGPGDWKYLPDEFISIKDMGDAAQIYLNTAYELPLR